jgi:hypothetical protein
MSSAFTFDFFVLSGDANHDRKVDATDLGVLASNWQGMNKTFAQGDSNYDGKVDIKDLLILASHWQQTLSTPPSAALISSPSRVPGRAPTRVAIQVLT